MRHGQHAVAGRRARGHGRRGRRGGLGDEELAHTHGEQGEGLRELVARVLAAAVVAAVMVVPGGQRLGSDVHKVLGRQPVGNQRGHLTKHVNDS